MNDFDAALFALSEEIQNLPEMKEYFSLKNIIKSNSEIISLDSEMRKHQKLMCKSKNNDETYLREKELYEKCRKELETNPLYQNYLAAKEEARNVLLEIKEQLE